MVWVVYLFDFSDGIFLQRKALAKLYYVKKSQKWHFSEWEELELEGRDWVTGTPVSPMAKEAKLEEGSWALQNTAWETLI